YSRWTKVQWLLAPYIVNMTGASVSARVPAGRWTIGRRAGWRGHAPGHRCRAEEPRREAHGRALQAGHRRVGEGSACLHGIRRAQELEGSTETCTGRKATKRNPGYAG